MKKTKLQTCIYLVSSIIMTQSQPSMAYGGDGVCWGPGNRCTVRGQALAIPHPNYPIDVWSANIMEPSQAFFLGNYEKFDCSGDDGRMHLGVLDGSIFVNEVVNGVESSMNTILTATAASQLAIRGDSNFFKMLSPSTQKFVRKNLGNKVLVIRSYAPNAMMVFPIPGDGINVMGEHVTHALITSIPEQFAVVNTLEEARNIHFSKFQQIDYHAKTYDNNSYPIGEDYTSLNDLALVFGSADVITKHSKTSGFVNAEAGLFKIYNSYTDDLNGLNPEKKDMPKPYATFSCKLVRYALK